MIDMPKCESHSLLASALVGRLSMVGSDGKPYTIPVRFVWHDQAVIVRIAYDGRKQEAIAHTRQVCFEVDEVMEDFSHYASVIIEGTLMDVQGEGEKRAALVALNEKYERLSGLPSPGPNPVTQGVAIRKILVQTLAGRKSEPAAVAPVVRKVPTREDDLLAYDRARRG